MIFFNINYGNRYYIILFIHYIINFLVYIEILTKNMYICTFYDIYMRIHSKEYI